ncbi:MAG TPA: PQQ-dependent sugar dehydrogenase [Thermoanaerobaculia bacterium]|nr:PQQ-dependent sugar dehydrogenase [Thermoanaerobaculia bacterium]
MIAALLLAATLVPQRVTLADGRRITLNLPPGYELRIAAEGLRRVRFMAKAPDGRLFVTDMYNRADNKRGKVYVLDGFDAATSHFQSITPYMTNLRNPNNVAFDGQWMYLPLTDKLLRYRYTAGSTKPTGEPQVLATFPDYGLDYKYGGWHLTRTVAIGPNGKVYVSVGSSCNACIEKEDVRATVLEMSPDGSNRKFFATGLRNAVGLKFVDGTLFATNMGADHLGDNAPQDTLNALQNGADYGWPYCYVANSRVLKDSRFASTKPCSRVPKPFAVFPAHASPLGIERFEDGFLVALHGSSKLSLNHGYRVAHVHADGKVDDFMTGFLANGKVIGRPADVFRLDEKTILVTDDYAGVIYAIVRK